MKSSNQKIYELLIADTTLVNLLASNTPLLNPTGTSAKTNSIVPSDMVNRKLNTPFITIQEGNENIDSHILYQTFYIRCYNDISKSYVEINTILDRVRLLITSNDLALTDRRFVKAQSESRLPGLVEEMLDLKFKEERFRVQVL